MPDLLVCLALTLTLIALSVPQFSRIRDSGLANIELSLLRQNSRAAQLASRQTESTLLLEFEEQTYIIRSSEPVRRTILRRNLPKGVFFRGATNSLPPPISFFPSGVVSPASLWLSTASRDCRITFSLYGRIKSTCQTRP